MEQDHGLSAEGSDPCTALSARYQRWYQEQRGRKRADSAGYDDACILLHRYPSSSTRNTESFGGAQPSSGKWASSKVPKHHSCSKQKCEDCLEWMLLGSDDHTLINSFHTNHAIRSSYPNTASTLLTRHPQPSISSPQHHHPH